RVEPLARVAETGGDRARVAPACGLGLAAGGGVGTVGLPARGPQQAWDVLHPLLVLQPQAVPLVGDRPDVGVYTNDRHRWGRWPAFGGRCDALSLGETGRGLELEHVRLERLHADLARGDERLRRERGRLLPVAGLVARHEHAREVVLGVGDPDARADA